MLRQGPGWSFDSTKPVIVHGSQWEAGEVGRVAHAHPRGQLVWADQGILRVDTCRARWVVPSSHAVWIPSHIVHEIVAETDASGCHVFLDSDVSLHLWRRCVVLHMTPLMRQLLLRFRQLNQELDPPLRHHHLAMVIVDELSLLPEAPLCLPSGTDPRLRRMTSYLLLNPQDFRTLSELVSFSGASVRTMERLFKSETGLSFTEWRGRLRLIKAVHYLSQGETSTEIARKLGYRSSSAFIAAFRRHFGTPPQSYLEHSIGMQSVKASE
ncbi:AraC family transcriptional regulator [Celerinatantimonas diazotrophica]|uniref:AraC family transcriptional regulator n=2 Tax=Celerinatantimonas diazotrophica TaxID=412034 RepID=A0A4V2PRV9_9GAMM|nr:AraC family transcriptional regulator [Celerinatantimonas diazotrophica]CAG9295080.1 HTH-type transcriptional regulator NimR [Celerinatantimonas diazotrophica]